MEFGPNPDSYFEWTVRKVEFNGWDLATAFIIDSLGKSEKKHLDTFAEVTKSRTGDNITESQVKLALETFGEKDKILYRMFGQALYKFDHGLVTNENASEIGFSKEAGPGVVYFLIARYMLMQGALKSQRCREQLAWQPMIKVREPLSIQTILEYSMPVIEWDGKPL